MRFVAMGIFFVTRNFVVCQACENSLLNTALESCHHTVLLPVALLLSLLAC